MRTRRKKQSKTIYFIIFLLFLLTLFIFDRCSNGALSGKNKADNNVKITNELKNSGHSIVHFLNVGQGDCTLIETHDGKFALIDASTQDSCDKIINYLESRNVKELEYVFFTHPHEDHIGCGDEIISQFKVANVIMTKVPETTSSYQRLIKSIEKSIKKHGTKLLSPKNGDVFMLSDTCFEVISDGKGYEDINNTSICLKMVLGESSFLFTGDAEKEVEDSILKGGFDIDVDVFHCGHHGSSTSNTSDFLDTVTPEYAIVSCGKDNDYGHPHKEVVSYFKSKNIPMLITHKNGDIVFSYNSEGVTLLSL